MHDALTQRLSHSHVLTPDGLRFVTGMAETEYGSIIGRRGEFEAWAWLQTYFEDFRAITRLAIERNWPQAWKITDGLAYFMRVRRNIPQAIELIDAARKIAALAGEKLGNYAKAQSHLNKAFELYGQLENPRNQAWILIELGTIDRQTGRYNLARERFAGALDHYDRAGDRSGHAWAVRELGIVARMTRHYPAAEEQLSEALAIFADIRSERNIADVHIELGTLYRATGALPKAREEAQLALRMYEKMGNVRGAAWAGLECGAIERMEKRAGAREFLEKSLAAYTRIGDRSGLARAYQELGLLAAADDDHAAARDLLNRALVLHVEMESPESAAIERMLASLRLDPGEAG